MRILISPYSKNLKWGDNQHPKEYPTHYLKKLISLLLADKHEIIQLGIDGEIALVKDFRKNLSFIDLKELIQSCDTFICIDTWLQHACNHYGKRGIVIFGQSDPNIFGYSDNINLLKDRKYLREKQFDIWEFTEYNQTIYNGDAFVEPEEVVKSIENFK